MKIDSRILTGFWASETKYPYSVSVYRMNGASQHRHNYWEIIAQLSGQTYVEAGDEAFVSLPGEICIIGPNETHSTRRITQTHELLLIQFESNAIIPFMKSLASYRHLAGVLEENLDYNTHIRIRDDVEIYQAINRIWEECSQRASGYDLEVTSLLLHIFAMLVRTKKLDSGVFDLEKKAEIEKISDAIHYIENHYDEKISLDELATQCYMTPFHFCRSFKHAVGCTAFEYLNSVRLKEAEMRLLQSDMRISEIAGCTGFASISYFNRVFKKRYQLPPRTYREQYSAN